MDISNTDIAAFQTSLQGLQRSSEQVTQASLNIAQGSGNRLNTVNPEGAELSESAQGEHLVENIVSLLEGEKLYQANAKVLSTSNNLVGTLLDIKA